jgi:uncharacterized protein YkwD
MAAAGATAQQAIGAWKTSPEHDANMLGGSYTRVGSCQLFGW